MEALSNCRRKLRVPKRGHEPRPPRTSNAPSRPTSVISLNGAPPASAARSSTPSIRLVLPEPFLPSRTVSGLNRSISACAKFLKSVRECMTVSARCPMSRSPAAKRTRPPPSLERGEMSIDWSPAHPQGGCIWKFRGGSAAHRYRRAGGGGRRRLLPPLSSILPLYSSLFPPSRGEEGNGGGPPFVRRRRCRRVLSAPSALLPPYSSLLPPFRGEVGRGVRRRRGGAALAGLFGGAGPGGRLAKTAATCGGRARQGPPRNFQMRSPRRPGRPGLTGWGTYATYRGMYAIDRARPERGRRAPDPPAFPAWRGRPRGALHAAFRGTHPFPPARDRNRPGWTGINRNGPG